MLHFVEQIMDVLMGWTNKKQTAFKTYEKKHRKGNEQNQIEKKKRKTNWREKTNQNKANLIFREEKKWSQQSNSRNEVEFIDTSNGGLFLTAFNWMLSFSIFAWNTAVKRFFKAILWALRTMQNMCLTEFEVGNSAPKRVTVLNWHWHDYAIVS